MLPVVAAVGATTVPALIHIQRRRGARRADAGRSGGRSPWRPISPSAISSARLIFRRHPADPVPAPARHRVRRARIPGARALQSRRPTSTWWAARCSWPSRSASPPACDGTASRASGRICVAAGGLSWYAFFSSGLHPALALVPIMPFLPHAARDPGFFVDARPRREGHAEPLRDLVEISRSGRVVLLRARQCGRAVGRPRGGHLGAADRRASSGSRSACSSAAASPRSLGLHLPHRVGWRELIVGGLIAAVGFSVGLFFHVRRSCPRARLRSEMSMGVLLSLAGGAAGPCVREVAPRRQVCEPDDHDDRIVSLRAVLVSVAGAHRRLPPGHEPRSPLRVSSRQSDRRGRVVATITVARGHGAHRAASTSSCAPSTATSVWRRRSPMARARSRFPTSRPAAT